MKWLVGLVATGFVVAVAFVVLAVTYSSPEAGHAVYPHSLLEADRVMTQRMTIEVGPGMQAVMPGYGMLQRSADPAYLRALEQHTYEFDRMLGRVP